MRLGIILNTNNPETAWNALRLGTEAQAKGSEVRMFLLGGGVELENIKDKTFDVDKALRKFMAGGGEVLACGTCLGIRHQQPRVYAVSNMSDLVEIIEQSDKVVTLG